MKQKISLKVKTFKNKEGVSFYKPTNLFEISNNLNKKMINKTEASFRNRLSSTNGFSQRCIGDNLSQSKRVHNTEENYSSLPTLQNRNKHHRKSIQSKQVPVSKRPPSSVIQKDLNRLKAQSPQINKKKKLSTLPPCITRARKQIFLSDLKLAMNKHAKNTKSERNEIKSELTRNIFSTLDANTSVTHQFTRNYFVNYDHRNVKEINEIKNKDFVVSFPDQLYFNLKINQIQSTNLQKKILRERVLRALISGAAHLKRLNMSIKDLMITANAPKEYKQSDYIKAVKAVKENKYSSLEKLLNVNQFLVTQVDIFNQTLLHVAAKREREKIVRLLLKRGSRIEAEDAAGRTPLHNAALFNNLENVKILLYEMASPFKKTHKGQYPVNLTNDRLVRFFLERARALHNFNIGIDMKATITRVQSGLRFFFLTPIRDIKEMIGIKD